jgi:hypothetical protein
VRLDRRAPDVAALRDVGAQTDGEFEAKKTELLGRK